MLLYNLQNYNKGVNMKRKFECPIHEDEEIDNIYTTEECCDCYYYWDCPTGLEETLNDNDFKRYHNEIKEALKELNEY